MTRTGRLLWLMMLLAVVLILAGCGPFLFPPLETTWYTAASIGSDGVQAAKFIDDGTFTLNCTLVSSPSSYSGMSGEYYLDFDTVSGTYDDTNSGVVLTITAGTIDQYFKETPESLTHWDDLGATYSPAQTGTLGTPIDVILAYELEGPPLFQPNEPSSLSLYIAVETGDTPVAIITVDIDLYDTNTYIE